MNKKEELIELYQNTSKHSNYQILPAAIKSMIPQDNLTINSRFEQERLDYLKKHLDFTGKKVLDIGGNTGFFSFEAIDAGAKEVVYIEGNTAHANFVKSAAGVLEKNIVAVNQYLDFSGNLEQTDFDIVLLFNVLHHLGDDFGDKEISLEKAKETMAASINYFHSKTDQMVLQLGFCWKGNRNLSIFENGTKAEMIEFVKTAIKGKWEIQSIGIAEKVGDVSVYNELNETNINRNESLGEFRNRPIFILKSI